MNLKQLKVFLAVAENGSFSKGAEATFLTQSTVSQHISALEDEFGLRLFDRTGKGAFLTPGGRILQQHATRVLAASHEIAPAMRRFIGLEETTLTIGGSNIPGTYMIPAILPAYLTRFPGLKITLYQGDSREILDRITAQEVEVGVIGSRFVDDDFDYEQMGNDTIRLVAAPYHEWSEKPGLTAADLPAGNYILREPGSGTGKTVAEALTEIGIDIGELKVRACLGSNEAVKNAVMGGAGLAFLSEMSISRELERGELAAIHVTGLEISRHFYLVSRSGRELSPAAVAFCSFMREQYTETGAAGI